MSTERICQAPIHVKDCNGLGTTLDHFTPKCIAKLMNWTDEQIEAADNLQYLSQACHVEKDRTTIKRFELLKRQLKEDENVAIEQVLVWARMANCNQLFNLNRGL